MAAAPVMQVIAVIMPVSVTVANVCTHAPYDTGATTSPLVAPTGRVGPVYNMIDVSVKT